MPAVTIKAYAELATVDRSAFIEGIEPSLDVEILESRPFDTDAVKKDAGLKNNSLQCSYVDDASLTLTQYLFTNRGVKIAFAYKYKEGATEAADDPKFEGTGVVQINSMPVVNGQRREGQFTLHVDGDVTMDVTP